MTASASGMTAGAVMAGAAEEKGMARWMSEAIVGAEPAGDGKAMTAPVFCSFFSL